MIISRTPYRISFFGGGTDYPGWYREHGGKVLATTIDKYCYVTCRYLPPFFDHRIRVIWSQIELAQCAEEIRHPSVRETLKYLNFQDGVEIHYDGDLPGQSGMGSSSAFTVGLIHALRKLKGEAPDCRQLFQDAIEIEQNFIRETVGSQDQVSAASGGFNRIVFGIDGEIDVEPIDAGTSRLDELNDNLMLFYTGMKRSSSEVAATYVCEIGSKGKLFRKTEQLADQGIEILERGGDMLEFGELLHEAWMTKREFSGQVSNPEIDLLYNSARANGATGGKLLGAGGGGFLLLFASPSKQERIRRSLGELVHVPFKFDSTGSQVIFSGRDSTN